MYKVIIYGIDKVYNEFKNIIDYEVLKNNFKIVAMASKDKFADYTDGFKVISISDIPQYEYDYIVVFDDNYEDIKKDILNIGIEDKKVFNGIIFKIPCFDFKRYVSLIENPVTIISDDCWGGQVYKYLRLKATSPFINMYILNNDFIKLCNNLDYYLEQPLVKERDNNIYNNWIPLGSLGKDEKKIMLGFNHHSTFETAYEDWTRRKERINLNNLFIKMSISLMFEETEEDIKKNLIEFEKLDYHNKVCFHPRGNGKSIVSLPRQFWNYENKIVSLRPNEIAPMARDIYNLTKQIDIFKLLTGEKDFIREKLILKEE